MYFFQYVTSKDRGVKEKGHFYFVLDSVMGSRVNIRPPFEVSSTKDPADSSNAKEIMLSEIILGGDEERQIGEHIYDLVSEDDGVSVKKRQEKKKCNKSFNAGQGQQLQKLSNCKLKSQVDTIV